MKPLLLLLPLLAFSVVPGESSKSGRAGNEAYEEESYEEAAAYYQQGLAGIEAPEPGPITHALYNNLGSAFYRMGDHEKATAAFAGALDLSSSNADFARGAYNAGNNAFRAQDAEAALEFYRSALLADPNNAAAKFNYEFVKRQQQQQQQNQQQQNDQQQQQNDQQNDQQQQDDRQNEQNQDDQQQQQQQQQQQNQQGEQQQPPPQQPEPDPNDITREQAERILQALQTDEKELLKDVKKMKARPRAVEKDW